ncbi:cyclase family protein [Fodinicurvata sediminis]|uniref:cyclase family protein n=1 Tax=Fodinicurvata sediminis TaxID=1121832 RepID=UPI0009DC4A9E|nr:cyclase family protein [Fodinicurvata sediminis]
MSGKPFALAFAAVVSAGLVASSAFAQDDEQEWPANAADAPEWCQSEWGAEDEIGSANLLSEELVLEAAKLVKTGKTYSLGAETNSETPAFGPRSWALVINQPGQVGGVGLGPNKMNYNDDIYMGYVGTGSQIDGLGHIGVDNVFYNCHHNSDFVQADGLTKLGIEKIPNFVTRGVVLDMTDHFDQDVLDEGTAFNRAEIEAQAEKQGVEIREGDVVLFHTGWLSLVGEDDDRYIAGEPGLGLDGAKYMVEKNVLAVGADTWGLEVIPFEEGTGVFEVHQELIAKNGIYILENMKTDELAADEAWEFMFVMGHSKFTGGVQAIINPTAIR